MDSSEHHRWLSQAKDDFAYGVEGVEAHPRGAVWNLHQAAEKALKGLLIRVDRDFPRTHDLPRLLTLVAEFEPGADVLKEAAFLLSSFLPMARYPGDLPEINTARAREAVQASREILDWVIYTFDR